MIKLEGLGELVAALKDLDPNQEDIIRASAKVGTSIVSALQAAAPVKSGGLKASIKIYMRKRKTGVTIGPEYGNQHKYGGGNHAHLIEYGHMSRDGQTYVPAQPFIRPTWARIRGSVESGLIKEMRDAIATKIRNENYG